MDKKVKVIISSISCFSIIASTTLITYSLSNEKKYYEQNKKPLNRGENYEKFDISGGFNKKQMLNLITKRENINNKFVLKFDKQRFKDNIENIIRSSLNSFDRFKQHNKEYKINLSYQFMNEFNIALDIVWYLQSKNPQYFYFQCEFNLN